VYKEFKGCRVSKAFRGLLDRRDFKGSQVLKEPMGIPDPRVPKVRKATRVIPERRELWVRPVKPDRKEHKAIKGIPARPVRRELKEIKEIPGRLGPLVRRVQLDPKERRETRGIRAQPETRVLLAQPGILARRVTPGYRGRLAQLAHRAIPVRPVRFRVLPETPGPRVTPGLREIPEWREQLGIRDPKEPQARPGQRGIRE
jgi:hypothetical protein